MFSERGGGVAFVSEQDGKSQVIHNGRAGKPFAAVGAIALSPDGKRHAYGALRDGAWRMVIDGQEGAPFSAVKLPAFSPDGAHVAYQAMAGKRWHLVVDATVNAGTATHYLQHEFDGTSTRIAFIEDVDESEVGRLVVSDLAFKTRHVVDTGIGGLLAAPGRSRLAAVAGVGRQQCVLTLAFDRPELVRRAMPYDAVSALVFGPDGGSVAYLAERAGQVLAVLDDQERPLPAEAMVVSPLVIRPDGKAVAALVALGGAVGFQELFQAARQGAAAYQEAEGPSYAADGSLHAYAASRDSRWFLVVNGKEGPPFDRVVSPLISPDGQRVVYRARQGGKRFVVVADPDGKTIRELPAHEQVFPVLFTGDGRSVAYGVKDGQRLAWKVEAL
jgi:hypothetical protein